MSNHQGALPELDDRSQLDLSTRKTALKKPVIIAVFSVVSLVALASAGWVWSRALHDAPPVVQKDQVATPPLQQDLADNTLKTSMAQISQNDDKQKALQSAAAAQQLDSQTQALQQQQQALAMQLKAMQATGGTGAPAVPTPRMRKASGAVLVNFGDDQQASQHESGPINDALRGEFYAPGTAAVRPSLRLLLIHGTNIPCVLKTRIVTDYKGLTVCQVTKDVYSADGSTVLIDRGSQVFGEQKMAILQGQSRVFINWTDIETPKGIKLRIDSLGTDALGAAGAEAWIDGHFAQRFGGAIMLSFLQDLFQTAANAANNNNNTVVYSNSQQATTDMAAEALKNTINIPPTAYINQGALLNVLVARDVDMSNVYE